MKKKLILVFCFYVSFLFAQKDSIIVNSYLVGGKKISLYFDSNSTRIKKCLNITPGDYYYESQIIFKRRNRFFAKLRYTGNNEIIYGWLDVKYFGVGLKSNSFNSIPVYYIPNKKSKIKMINVHIESVIAKVINIDENWLKIYFYNKGKRITGWLSSDNQCYNLYTMCSGN